MGPVKRGGGKKRVVDCKRKKLSRGGERAVKINRFNLWLNVRGLRSPVFHISLYLSLSLSRGESRPGLCIYFAIKKKAHLAAVASRMYFFFASLNNREEEVWEGKLCTYIEVHTDMWVKSGSEKK